MRIQTDDGRVENILPSPDLEYPIDESLIAELKAVSDFASDYALGNFPRIAADVADFSSFFADDKAASIFEIGGIPPVFSALLRKNGFVNITAFEVVPIVKTKKSRS